MRRAILIISADEVNYVEKSTRNQSSSAVRHDQRAGQITSPTVQDSIVKKICRKHKRQTKAPAVEWENRNELCLLVVI